MFYHLPTDGKATWGNVLKSEIDPQPRPRITTEPQPLQCQYQISSSPGLQTYWNPAEL